MEMKAGRNVSFMTALSGATFAEFCSTAQCGAARHGAAFCWVHSIKRRMRRGMGIKLKH